MKETLIIEMHRSDVGIELLKVEDSEGTTFVVHWTDYVANDWRREYASESHAWAWIAFLIRCEESGFELFEGHGSFEAKAAAFFEEVAK